MKLFFDFEPRTSKQIADQLGLSKSKVHYHVLDLHRVGLLQLVETKEKGGVIEKNYLPIARRIKIKSSMQEHGDVELHAGVSQFGKTIVDQFLPDYKKATKAAERRRAEGLPSNGRQVDTAVSWYHLTPEQVCEVQKELIDLMDRWDARFKDQKGMSGALYYQVFSAILPSDANES
ncbi:MAG: helix-turn-helix domain-containing protein [Tumebacillaceae bacterium]